MKNLNPKYRKILGTILLIMAVIILFHNPIKRVFVRSYRPTISQSLIKKNQKKDGTYDYKQVKTLTMANLARARAGAHNIPIVGTISIPDINLNLPIAKGITNQNLAFAAGTFRPDMKMGQGNYALAGHNMASAGPKILFSPLYYRAKVGQKVYISDLKHIYQYRIYKKQFISKYDVNVVKNTHRKIITLITCDATGANRLLVRGKYEKKVPYKHATKHVRKVLSHPYNNN